MDKKFHPAMKAIKAGDVERLRELVTEDPSLATSGSTRSHPTLLQCLVLDANGQPNARAMVEVLIEAGAELNEPLVAAGSIGNREVAELLLDRGAEINAIPGGFDYAGTGLHYAALNGHRAMIEFLLDRGADKNVKDTKVGSTAAGWVEYGKHPELLDLLQ
jgi:ankyrin repeat protein